MCAVVHGHLIGKRLEGQPADVASLKWYQTALNSNGSVAYTNLYTYGKNNERLLTMAVRFGDGNVLALNLYPERLNGLLAENQMPKHSYYYLCDPSGNIMFTINDRNLSIEEQQPYVDKILRKSAIPAVMYLISPITRAISAVFTTRFRKRAGYLS